MTVIASFLHARSRVIRLNAAVDALNGRHGRPLIGYGQCGDHGGYVGAKIAYGRIPALEDFHEDAAR